MAEALPTIQQTIQSATAGGSYGPGVSYTPIQPPTVPQPVQAKPAPTVVNSNVARTEADMNAQYLANNVTYEQAKAIEKQVKDHMAAVEASKKQTPLYSTLSSLSNVNLNAKGDKVVQQEGMSAADVQRAQREADMRAIQGELDRVQQNMDARTATTIENIKQEYAQLEEEQRLANTAYESGVQTAGLVSGRSQYAPEIQQGIIKGAINEGISKLSKLQAKKAQLINEAEAARDERNYKLLSAKMDALRQATKDERDYALKLQDNVREAAKEQRDKIKFDTERIAVNIADYLTGNKANDNAILQQVSQQTGYAPAYILSAVENYKAQKMKDQPASVQEYLFAVNNQGYKGTLLQYQSAKAAAGRAVTVNALSPSEATALGLPKSMVGMNEQQVYQSLKSTTPPQWFIEIKPTNTQEEWNKFKNEVPSSSGVSVSSLLGAFANSTNQGSAPSVDENGNPI